MTQQTMTQQNANVQQPHIMQPNFVQPQNMNSAPVYQQPSNDNGYTAAQPINQATPNYGYQAAPTPMPNEQVAQPQFVNQNGNFGAPQQPQFVQQNMYNPMSNGVNANYVGQQPIQQPVAHQYGSLEEMGRTQQDVVMSVSAARASDEIMNHPDFAAIVNGQKKIATGFDITSLSSSILRDAHKWKREEAELEGLKANFNDTVEALRVPDADGQDSQQPSIKRTKVALLIQEQSKQIAAFNIKKEQEAELKDANLLSRQLLKTKHLIQNKFFNKLDTSLSDKTGKQIIDDIQERQELILTNLQQQYDIHSRSKVLYQHKAGESALKSKALADLIAKSEALSDQLKQQLHSLTVELAELQAHSDSYRAQNGLNAPLPEPLRQNIEQKNNEILAKQNQYDNLQELIQISSMQLQQATTEAINNQNFADQSKDQEIRLSHELITYDRENRNAIASLRQQLMLEEGAQVSEAAVQSKIDIYEATIDSSNAALDLIRRKGQREEQAFRMQREMQGKLRANNETLSQIYKQQEQARNIRAQEARKQSLQDMHSGTFVKALNSAVLDEQKQ